jgi:tetratricopeptide (TPR) repeat protein
MSYEQHEPRIVRTPEARQYLAAVEAVNAGQWGRALPLLRELAAGGARHADIHHLLSVAALAMGDLEEALEHASRALRVKPDDGRYLLHAVQVVSRVHSPQRALELARRAEPQVWGRGELCMQLSALYSKANAYGEAARLSARAHELLPADASSAFNFATTLLFCGELDKAERMYQEALKLDPTHAQAHLGLAQLRTWSPIHNHVERLRARLAVAVNPEDRMYLSLALSKELEDIGQEAESYEHLVAGKKAGAQLSGRTIEAEEQALFAQLESTAADCVQHAEGCDSEEPIFVMGMPRTGTTLVERILSSHSAVQSVGEILNFPVQLKRASGLRAGALLDTGTVRAATAIDWRELGNAYVASTRPLTGGSKHFVDKHPHNFLYMAMIARALPRAKLICLRRDALDTCLSNFRQLFSPASPFHRYSFDLLHTGRYFARFRRLMLHFEELLGDRVLWVDYENLVAEQEIETRRLLDFCRLGWEPACMQFERNAAPVATASAPQVRGKLHRGAVDRWRRYATQLQPLAAQLSAEGVHVAMP